MTWFNAKAMPRNDIDYSCYIKVIQFIYQIIYIDGDHITPLVIDSLKADTDTHAHAHTQTHTHTYTQTCIPMFRIEAILSG